MRILFLLHLFKLPASVVLAWEISDVTEAAGYEEIRYVEQPGVACL